jgi:hypothetical protein
MAPRCFVLLLAASTVLPAGPLLVEGFNDITDLAGKGWVQVNNSSPVGTTGWFQGNPAVFSAQAGAAEAYIAANFLNADFGGNISNWLLTPVLPLQNGETIRFYTRTEDPPLFADRLELRLSVNGSSSDVGSTDISVGDFTVLLLTINPALYPTGYPSQWTSFSATLSGLAAPGTGRFAFRYFVPDTSTNADYIGIDTVSVASAQGIPEPGTIVLLGLGIAGLVLWRRWRTPSRHLGYTAAALGAILWLGAAGVCAAGEDGKKVPTTTSAKAKPADAKPAPAAGGMRVFIDPATGKIRPPEQEDIQRLTALRAARATALAAPPQPLKGPGGAIGLKLDESHMVYSVARKNADGTVSFECVDGSANAAKALSRPPAERRHTDVR